jgi:hypothetical protein
MTSVEMINEFPSLANAMLRIGWHLDAVNLEMMVGGDVGEVIQCLGFGG